MKSGAWHAVAALLGTLVVTWLLIADVAWVRGPLSLPRAGEGGLGALGALGTLRGAWLAALVFALIVGVLARARAGNLSPRLAVAALTAASCLLGFALHATSDSGLFRVPDGIYSGFDSSYYADTVFFDGPGHVVREWHTTKRELSPRSQTHPPGPVLLFACTNAAARGLAGSQEDDGFGAFRLEGILPGILLPILTVLWLPALFALARRSAGERAALFAVALGAVLPAPLLMGPGTDTLAPLFGVVPLALLVRGWRERRGSSTVLAGLVFAVALLFGFHYLTAGLPWLLYVLFHARDARDARSGLAHLAGTTLVAALALVTLRALGYDFVRDFRASLGFHASGVTALRPYFEYLFWSPYSFFFWTTLPVALAFAIAGVTSLRGTAGSRAALVGFVSIAILDLAGLSRGETERLWLHLVPFVVLPVAILWSRESASSAARFAWLGAVFASTLVYKTLLTLGLFKV